MLLQLLLFLAFLSLCERGGKCRECWWGCNCILLRSKRSDGINKTIFTLLLTISKINGKLLKIISSRVQISLKRKELLRLFCLVFVRSVTITHHLLFDVINLGQQAYISLLDCSSNKFHCLSIFP